MQSRSAEPLLDIKHLSLSFPSRNNSFTALDDIDLSLSRGEILGVVGESGSGKSVLALSIMGLLPGTAQLGPKSSIQYHSRQQGICELNRLPETALRSIRGNEITMVFQEPMSSLNPVITCGRQIAEVLALHRGFSAQQARNSVMKLLDEVQLPNPAGIYQRYPHELSGGQKQRVMIAMAMACKPALLIADEPTTALDVTVQAGILRLLEQLRDEYETSVLFITHDLGVVAEIADRVLVLKNGELVEQGSVFDLFSRPIHPYTKGLIACRPRLDMKLRRLPTIAEFMPDDRHSQKSGIYHSVGQALLLNAEPTSETIIKRMKPLQGKALLRVRNLCVEFPVRRGLVKRDVRAHVAVDEVSFEVFPGETVGLVGESGCGKTTIGKCILGLLEPKSGEIEFEGKKIGDMASRELRRYRTVVQMLFQDPYSSLNPRMLVGAAIMEPMEAHRLYGGHKFRRARAMHLLNLVGMEASAFHRYPHEFSGGQRQRIGIARALSLNPRFIVCDESVSALDVSIQAQVLNLFNDLKDELGFTALFISHDLSVVKFIADRILVMRQGKLVEMGYSDALFERPKEEYTRKLINAIPRGSIEDIRRAQMRRRLLKARKDLL